MASRKTITTIMTAYAADLSRAGTTITRASVASLIVLRSITGPNQFAVLPNACTNHPQGIPRLHVAILKDQM